MRERDVARLLLRVHLDDAHTIERQRR